MTISASAAEFKQFVQAVGTRYSGTYDPTQNKSVPGDPDDLPRISFWEIWHEPNFGPDLAPQAIRGSSVFVAPGMYRNLANAAWRSLQATGLDDLLGWFDVGTPTGHVRRDRHPAAQAGQGHDLCFLIV